MIQGLYTAASGMIAVEGRQDIIANNIANTGTPGFKRQEPVQLGFYQIFNEQLRHPFHYNRQAAPAGGVKIVETFPQLASGTLRPTGNTLDLGLRGPGFMVVDTPGGERFTRSGEFTVDVDGHLATRDGYKVQSVAGAPIDVRGGAVVVAQGGGVTVDGVPAGQVRMVEFTAPERLERQGDSLYRASEAVRAQMTDASGTTIEQGQIEMSNVNVTLEMSKMMLGLRAYEANQRVIQTIDSTVGRMIDQVGMPR